MCLAWAPEAAFAGEQRFAALSLGSANPHAGGARHRTYERYGQFAQASGSSLVAREIFGEPSKPVPMTIKLPEGNRKEHRFITITGLPEGFRMSSGFPTKAVWLVSAREVADLQLLPPPNFIGKITLRISLMVDGAKAEEQPVGIIIRPRADEVMIPPPNPGLTSSISTTIEPPPSAAAPPPAPLPRKLLSDDEENAGLERAATFIAKSDIAAARLIYETMAMKGSARAAFAMGQTYDPQYLADKRIGGLQPDIERARRWYRTALTLGSQAAKAMLGGLEGR
jgi:hypothetical protein